LGRSSGPDRDKSSSGSRDVAISVAFRDHERNAARTIMIGTTIDGQSAAPSASRWNTAADGQTNAQLEPRPQVFLVGKLTTVTVENDLAGT
jgi:hypothetical protein